VLELDLYFTKVFSPQ